MKKTRKRLLIALLALTVIFCAAASAFAGVVTVSDGEYKAEMATGEKMFKVVDCKLTVKDGKAQAEILLSGSSYYALVMGTEEDALADYNAKDESKWIKADGEREYVSESGETKTGRVYTIPVESLDDALQLISVSEKYYNQGNIEKMFYERSITFDMDTMTAISLDLVPVKDENTGDSQTGNQGNNNEGQNNQSSGGESLLLALLSQVNVGPTGEAVFHVPLAFAVAYQYNSLHISLLFNK